LASETLFFRAILFKSQIRAMRMTSTENAGLGRRVLAMLYDTVLLAGIVFLAATLVVVATGGHASADAVSRLAFQLYLLGVIFLFFGWFWTHGGQTLGMRAWRLRAVTANGLPLNWTRAALRFFSAFVSLAAFGIGFLWMLADRDRLMWHDRLSRTRIVLLPTH
jgi:uncharacterized RDD family membrane protein YckC